MISWPHGTSCLDVDTLWVMCDWYWTWMVPTTQSTATWGFYPLPPSPVRERFQLKRTIPVITVWIKWFIHGQCNRILSISLSVRAWFSQLPKLMFIFIIEKKQIFLGVNWLSKWTNSSQIDAFSLFSKPIFTNKSSI